MKELVQFKINHYAIGDEIIGSSELDNKLFDYELFLNWPEDLLKQPLDLELVISKVEEKHNEWESDSIINRINYPFIYFEPTTYLSEMADWCGMEDDVHNLGPEEVFGDHLVEILKLSEEFGYHYKKENIGRDASKVVSVITVWDYQIDRDYDGECNTWNELVGAIKMDNIGKLL